MPDNPDLKFRVHNYVFWAAIAISFLFCLFSVIYHYNIAWSVDVDPKEKLSQLGQRGDFFGGFMNPILTLFTFTAFIYTIALQRKELYESRIQFKRSADALASQNEAIRLQNYQASFFHLLGVHNDIVKSIEVEDPADGHAKKSGRAAFQVIYSKVRRIYREKRKKFPTAGDQRALIFAYGAVYREHQYELGHYMRFLYNSIRMLKDNPNSEQFIKLIRSQLSNQELLVLYYNCTVSEFGQNFKALAEEYELFNNMPPQVLDESHSQLIDPKAFGKGGYARIKQEAGPPVRGDLSDRRNA